VSLSIGHPKCADLHRELLASHQSLTRLVPVSDADAGLAHIVVQYFKFCHRCRKTRGKSLPELEQASLSADNNAPRDMTSLREEFKEITLDPCPDFSPIPHFLLHVRQPSGITIDLEVTSKQTVADLKRQLQAVEGTHAHTQRLLCNGTLMVDERSLNSYKLQSGSVVLAVPQTKAVQKAGKEKAASASRGFLMVPGLDAAWKPHTASKLDHGQVDGFFDSSNLPAPWKVAPSPRSAR